MRSRLGAYVYPWLGKEAIEDITAPVLLDVLRRVENKGVFGGSPADDAGVGGLPRRAEKQGRRDADSPQSESRLTPLTLAGLSRFTRSSVGFP